MLCRVALLCTTLDLPARAAVLNFIQFNGYWGCCRCLQKGTRVESTHTYPYIEDNPCGPPRSHKKSCEDAGIAMEKDTNVEGVKGPSWLSVVPCFDLIKGTSVDYMHCVLLGVCRLLLRLWLQSSNHQSLWYIGTRVPDLDARLCSIQPPDEMQRTPRSMASTLKFWKAHELRAWLLHYSPVVLYGVLPDAYYQHHLLLVEAVFLLLQDEVHDRDIEQSLRLLQHYCFMFAPLYGKQHMTANLHSLLHLPEVVRHLGPLWAHSCFPYEDANGDLLTLFHGSHAVEKQIVEHINTLQQLPSLAQSTLLPNSSQQGFYHKMTTKGTHGRKSQKIDEHLSVVGSPHYAELCDSEKALLLQAGGNPPTQVLLYPRLLLPNHRELVAETRSRSTKRNNSCLLYKSGEAHKYGVVQKIISFWESATVKCFVLLKRLEPASLEVCDDQLTHANFKKHFVAFFPPRSENQVAISATEILDKCVYINIAKYIEYVFVSHLPNTVEVE